MHRGLRSPIPRRNRSIAMTIPTNANLINQYVGTATFQTGPGTGNVRSSCGSGGTSWYEAMSRAWGQTLDAQATHITELSDQIGTGSDQPSQMVALTDRKSTRLNSSHVNN